MVGSVGKGQSKCGETNIQISADRGVHIILQKKKKKRDVHIYYPTMFQIYLPSIKRIYGKEKKK